jgi:hypothetical protein
MVPGDRSRVTALTRSPLRATSPTSDGNSGAPWTTGGEVHEAGGGGAARPRPRSGRRPSRRGRRARRRHGHHEGRLRPPLDPPTADGSGGVGLPDQGATRRAAAGRPRAPRPSSAVVPVPTVGEPADRGGRGDGAGSGDDGHPARCHGRAGCPGTASPSHAACGRVRRGGAHAGVEGEAEQVERCSTMAAMPFMPACLRRG